MDQINPAFDAEAQRADTSEARRSGTYFSSLEQDFTFILAPKIIMGIPLASFGQCTLPRPRRRIKS
jgi:hypothetical protein